jgi:LemA protein
MLSSKITKGDDFQGLDKILFPEIHKRNSLVGQIYRQNGGRLMGSSSNIKVVFIIIGLIVLVGFVFAGQYNSLVKMDEGVKAAWAQVENQLQRRYDLIPNLVETVKGYAAHEKEVLLEVTEARAKVGQARSPEEKIEANNRLSSALGRLLVVVERYPDLKANQNFIRLQDELAGTENRIAVERRRYNEAVRAYNAKIRSFPTNLIASMFGFEEAAKEAPKVKF